MNKCVECKDNILPKNVKGCPNCGAKNPRAAKFCVECGKSMTQKGKCPKCGAEVSSKSKFCPECGEKLG